VVEPTQVKHYEILDRLGEGGMGVVYRARDTRLGRVVALKMLSDDLSGNEERSRRFEREARIVSTLSHPGIATLYDFDRDGDTAFLTMELVEGSNLRQVLGQGPMPLPDVLECALQVSDALAAAHKNGVVHRDLKPENIMVADSGYYKVLDFGVARLEDVSSTEAQNTQTPTRTWHTRAGTLIGTVAYMSPEQILGKTADPRSDIFSLGSVLYEMATSEAAFPGPSDIAVAHAVAYETPRPVRETRKEIPRSVAAVIDKCLAKQPDDRYQTTDELVLDLRLLRTTTMTGSGSTRGLLAFADATRKTRRRIGLGLVAALIVAAAAVGAWNLWPSPDVERPAPAVPAVALPAVQREAPPRVIVAFFADNTGDPRTAWISRGLPEMLTTDLSTSSGLEVIATQRLHDLLASAGRDPDQGLDRSTTAELARWAGADVVISGSVFQAGDRFRIDAQAYDTSTGTVLAAHKAEGKELFSLVDELTTGLLAGLEVAPETEDSRSVTTSDEALQAFLAAKGHYENLMFEEAEDNLGRALAADPEFALARLHLAMSRISRGDVEAATAELERVSSEADALPRAEKLLAQALNAYYVDRDPELGNRQIEMLLQQFPRHAGANVWWGRALFDVAGKPLAAARKLHVALEQDSNDLLAVAALAEQLHRLGASEDARQMLVEAQKRNPDAAAALDRMLESY
jgi:TolB-like protein/predicted Ser/Thr protein kinase